MDYKVCILAAGLNKDIKPLSDKINSAILPVDQKGVLSHIIEKFPQDTEFVIAVGHKKECVIDYVKIAHPNAKVTFVTIDRFIGPGSGPGLTLLSCKEHLQCPFILSVADTLVLEEIPEPKNNWFGIAPVKKTEEYCTVKIKNNLVVQLDDKIKNNNKFAFIGLAGIRDYKEFFEELEQNQEIKKGELQVSNGFRKLIEKKLEPVGFTWFDTGSYENYVETNRNLSGGNKEFDFSKTNEFIYFVDKKVIKFFVDKKRFEQRYLRGQNLKGLCPQMLEQRGSFYSYEFIEGQTLYNVLNRETVRTFFEWCKQTLWKDIILSNEENKVFESACKQFYQDKTLKRIKLFYEKNSIEDEESIINGRKVPRLEALFNLIDWKELEKGCSSQFHGDLQFDNIIVLQSSEGSEKAFSLIDWRDNFGGLVNVGDKYYDLAKLYGGTTISYHKVKEGKFSFEMSGNEVFYNFILDNNLVEAKEELEQFIEENKFNRKKIEILRALIFLNMSPLHHEPFDKLLYFMGKLLLSRAVVNK